MIEAKVVKSRQGDFNLLRSGSEWFIGVLIPNFYPNSHFDISKIFILDENDLLHEGDLDYLIRLAESIRNDWTRFSDREVNNIKVVK
ncbi:hypothetical protein RM155_11765 [Pantoea agglomerans]|uniref:hypothetical protein n=1 Tax=Enterobacter agglomerans TaxID=549 RepID=UPI000D6B4007|nr:hypothetical protein [Pantoea agglomerans]WNK70038.1 hypothetical protein RM155_11765 [Pantoea agglomerans]